MFGVASKKLGLDKVVLGKKANDDDPDGDGLVKGMSKEEIEKVLFFYFLFIFIFYYFYYSSSLFFVFY